jgi:hypothetical protein
MWTDPFITIKETRKFTPGELEALIQYLKTLDIEYKAACLSGNLTKADELCLEMAAEIRNIISL